MSFVTFSRLGFMGELGNQMFQVAATVGYSKKYSKEPIFPRWTCKLSGMDYSSVFENPIDQSLDQEKYNQIKNYFHYEGLIYQEIPPCGENLDLIGYFQSESYFENCKDEIRKIFAPSSRVRDYIEKKYEKIISLPNRVSLQVRTLKRSANDYDLHASAGVEFIQESQKHFSEDSTFVVFADNMHEAKKNLPSGKKYILVENEPNFIDLFLMTYFESYIVSSSTFGWWGAWLSQHQDPKVIIKKDWFTKGKSKEYLNENSIIPQRWKKIDK